MDKKKYKLIKTYPNSPDLGCIVWAYEGQSVTIQLGDGLNFEPFVEVTFIPSMFPDNWVELEKSCFVTDDGETVKEGEEYWLIQKRTYIEGILPESNMNCKKYKFLKNII